jgi:hypothetical protein
MQEALKGLKGRHTSARGAAPRKQAHNPSSQRPEGPTYVSEGCSPSERAAPLKALKGRHTSARGAAQQATLYFKQHYRINRINRIEGWVVFRNKELGGGSDANRLHHSLTYVALSGL